MLTVLIILVRTVGHAGTYQREVPNALLGISTGKKKESLWLFI